MFVSYSHGLLKVYSFDQSLYTHCILMVNSWYTYWMLLAFSLYTHWILTVKPTSCILIGYSQHSLLLLYTHWILMGYPSRILTLDTHWIFIVYPFATLNGYLWSTHWLFIAYYFYNTEYITMANTHFLTILLCAYSLNQYLSSK